MAKHPQNRLNQWRKYYSSNQARITARVAERREYLQKANKTLLRKTGQKEGCWECKEKFQGNQAPVEWFYNDNCSFFGAMLGQKLQTIQFFDRFAPKWGRFFCSSCFNSFIKIKGNTRHKAYKIQ
jgi:hypothetical protein